MTVPLLSQSSGDATERFCDPQEDNPPGDPIISLLLGLIVLSRTGYKNVNHIFNVYSVHFCFTSRYRHKPVHLRYAAPINVKDARCSASRNFSNRCSGNVAEIVFCEFFPTNSMYMLL